MLQANIPTTKSNFFHFLEKVQQGETIVISDYSRLIALLFPYQTTTVSKQWRERLTLLSKNLKITLPKRSKKEKLKSPLVPRKPVHLLSVLLECTESLEVATFSGIVLEA